jgi:adenylate cyclase
MSDIFISYSSKDRAQADQLSELLRSAGLSVWIDQDGIEVATSWSREIVQAINDCKAFVVLLSPSSLGSHNVMKEVSLASEKRKKILPLDLEPVTLNTDFEYALAGLQRSPMTNIDGIIRALSKLGLDATGAPVAPKIVKEIDARKSLMILPFEDLSPTADNEWFTDGMASELIGALSKVKALRVVDWNTSKLFRERRVKTIELARELDVRYFIEGQVRKFGDKIKISVTLLDIEAGEHLWQDFLRGTMEDVFDIQEQVAIRVVDGLQLHLSPAEKESLCERGTENAEAYEFYLKAVEYSSKHTKLGAITAIDQATTALKLDPDFADLIMVKASMLRELYRHYDNDPAYLAEAESLALRALELTPENYNAYDTLATIYRLQGKMEKSRLALTECIRVTPDTPIGHFTLGMLYSEQAQLELAARHYESCIALQPDYLAAYWNLVLILLEAGRREHALTYAKQSLQFYAKRLRLTPDDEHWQSVYCAILEIAGESERALLSANELSAKQHLDGGTLYNLTCLYTRLGDLDRGLKVFERSISAGFRSVELFLSDPDLDPLRTLPEFKAILTQIKQLPDLT